MSASFKQRLASGERIVGTFVKTPSPILVEVLGLTTLDCLCLDAEHAPFDRAAIDGCIMAARAAGMPALVRIPAIAPEQVLSALDCGASGIVAPHVRSAADARDLVRISHYAAGGRGYAGSSRAAAYTTRSMAQNLATGRDTIVIAQIEDPEAIDAIDAIAAVDGIDALFVGRADLTVAYGAATPNDAAVVDAVHAVCAAGRRHDRRVGMFLPRIEDVPFWAEQGASLFLLGSDHGFVLAGADGLVRRAKGERAQG